MTDCVGVVFESTCGREVRINCDELSNQSFTDSLKTNQNEREEQIAISQ